MSNTFTTKQGLIKPTPGTGDLVDITELNQNADKLDQNTPNFVCTSSTRPGIPFIGMKIFETDTKQEGTWNGTSWIGIRNIYGVGLTYGAISPSVYTDNKGWWLAQNGMVFFHTRVYVGNPNGASGNVTTQVPENAGAPQPATITALPNIIATGMMIPASSALVPVAIGRTGLVYDMKNGNQLTLVAAVGDLLEFAGFYAY